LGSFKQWSRSGACNLCLCCCFVVSTLTPARPHCPASLCPAREQLKQWQHLEWSSRRVGQIRSGWRPQVASRSRSTSNSPRAAARSTITRPSCPRLAGSTATSAPRTAPPVAPREAPPLARRMQQWAPQTVRRKRPQRRPKSRGGALDSVWNANAGPSMIRQRIPSGAKVLVWPRRNCSIQHKPDWPAGRWPDRSPGRGGPASERPSGRTQTSGSA